MGSIINEITLKLHWWSRRLINLAENVHEVSIAGLVDIVTTGSGQLNKSENLHKKKRRQTIY
ncbi:hypothetical protein TcasGA2_TC012352 [Tribolium castaneum]|uniref:Uncharacterized protein n=1 Tax=Tribolium castaneum TaxID=7070 RepID=D6X1T9_TRICA|nr:hypothetical protein TcasGA2_TC012352 [Tribolium castaneum]